MNHGHTAESLIAFEKRIAELYDAGKIRAPVHLDGGNENHVLDIFKKIHKGDWLCNQWRSHYACLLMGVPPDELEADILAGKSITLCYPKYHIISSAIAGGIAPIALGIAWQIKQINGKERVWCFIGDMTAEMGVVNESMMYGWRQGLPIEWVIADNNKSVMTDSEKTWGYLTEWEAECVHYYRYAPIYPHAGAGRRVNF